MTREQFIEATTRGFFAVEFFKKDGTMRSMRCRRSGDVRGELMPVVEVLNGGATQRRVVNVTTVVSARIAGKTYQWDGFELVVVG